MQSTLEAQGTGQPCDALGLLSWEGQAKGIADRGADLEVALVGVHDDRPVLVVGLLQRDGDGVDGRLHVAMLCVHQDPHVALQPCTACA